MTFDELREKLAADVQREVTAEKKRIAHHCRKLREEHAARWDWKSIQQRQISAIMRALLDCAFVAANPMVTIDGRKIKSPAHLGRWQGLVVREA